MSGFMHNRLNVHLGDNVKMVGGNKDYSLFEVKDETGSGTMEVHHLFPGIELIYNDFHMETCFSEFYSENPLLGIDHCKEGRIEWEMDAGNYLYLQENDLQVSSKSKHVKSFRFPLSHYHGITVGVYLENLDGKTKSKLEDFNINMERLYEKHCNESAAYINSSNKEINDLFNSLYNRRNSNETAYLQIKIIELFCLLQQLDSKEREQRGYFSKKQVEIIKDIEALLTEEIDKNYTIEQLSIKFKIPPTSMKICFKGVYGSPIGQYLRNYRMNIASKILREDKVNISQIAGMLGYDNQSKFAAAFKKIMGKTPTEYRKLSVYAD